MKRRVALGGLLLALVAGCGNSTPPNTVAGCVESYVTNARAVLDESDSKAEFEAKVKAGRLNRPPQCDGLDAEEIEEVRSRVEVIMTGDAYAAAARWMINP